MGVRLRSNQWGIYVTIGTIFQVGSVIRRYVIFQKGNQMDYKTGEWLKQRYEHSLANFNSSSMTVKSSPLRKCVLSAAYFVRAFTDTLIIDQLDYRKKFVPIESMDKNLDNVCCIAWFVCPDINNHNWTICICSWLVLRDLVHATMRNIEKCWNQKKLWKYSRSN